MFEGFKKGFDRKFSYSPRKRNKKREIKKTMKKPVEDWFPIASIEERYTQNQDRTLSYMLKVEQLTSNFLPAEDMEKIAAKFTERFSNISVEYSYLSLVKAKDTTIYTNWLQKKMDESNDLYIKNGLYNLRQYINKKAATGNFNDRDFYLIFSCYEENREEFEIILSQIKNDLALTGMNIQDIHGKEIVNVLYAYLNPDINVDFAINDYSTFITNGKG